MSRFYPFVGQRRAFLEERWYVYLKLWGKNDLEMSNMLAIYISATFVAKFHWWLPVDVDLDPNAVYDETTLPMATLLRKRDLQRDIVEKVLTWLGFMVARHNIEHKILLFEAQYGVMFCAGDHAQACRIAGARQVVDSAHALSPPQAHATRPLPDDFRAEMERWL